MNQWFEYPSPPKEELEKQITNIERGLKEDMFTDIDFWNRILKKLKREMTNESNQKNNQ